VLLVEPLAATARTTSFPYEIGPTIGRWRLASGWQGEAWRARQAEVLRSRPMRTDWAPVRSRARGSTVSMP